MVEENAVTASGAAPVRSFGSVMQHFMQPWLLVLLAVLPALAWLAAWSWHKRRTLVARLGPSSVIAAQTVRPNGRWRIALGWTAGLSLLVIAAAGPQWGKGPSAIQPGRDVVVVLDLSKSMLAQDALPSRLGKAKEGLREFVDAVQARGGHRLALVAFAGKASVVVPLTQDYDHFRSKLAELSADPPPASVRGEAVSGTRIGAGLRMAVGLLDERHRGAQEIILVSDGDDPVHDDEWRLGLAAAREAGVPVDVVGVGDPDHDSPIMTANGRLKFQGREVTSRLHESMLREIASKTGGTFVAAHLGSVGLDALFRDRIEFAPTREAIANTLPQPIGRQLLFLVLALLSIVGAMVPLSLRAAARNCARNVTTVIRRICRTAAVAVSIVLVSATPQSDWLRRGNDALSRGQPDVALVEYARAAQRTNDPGEVAFNEGVALYRLGRYRDAELHFRRALSDAQGARRVRALYNLGSALLQESQGRLKAPLRNAVEVFEQARGELRIIDPLADDIRHNLELAKRLLAGARDPNQDQPDEPPDSHRPPQSQPGGAEQPDQNLIGRQPSASQIDPSGRPQPRGKLDGDNVRQQTDRPPPPGKGNLPPLPDEDALSPLSLEDTQAHLQRAAERIESERKAKLQSSVRPLSTNFPEW